MNTWEAPEPTVRHPRAAWGDRADHMLISAFYADGVLGWEELPVRRRGRDTWYGRERFGKRTELEVMYFEICCIPFFSEPEQLGTTVITTPEAPDLIRDIEGGFDMPTLRLRLGESEAAIERIERDLDAAGWFHERHQNLLVVSALEGPAADAAKGYLDERASAGDLRWVT